jgi:hypothetical protein
VQHQIGPRAHGQHADLAFQPHRPCAIDGEHLQCAFGREQRGIAARILPQAGHQPRRRHQVVVPAIGAQRDIDARCRHFGNSPRVVA